MTGQEHYIEAEKALLHSARFVDRTAELEQDGQSAGGRLHRTFARRRSARIGVVMTTLSISASTFVELLNRAIPFAGRDDTLPVLMAVELECIGDGWLTASGTDRYRLGHARAKVADDVEPFRFLLGLKDAERIVKLFKEQAGPGDFAVSLRVGEAEAVVSGPSLALTCQQVSGERVKYRRLIADAQSSVSEPGPFGANMKFIADFAKVVRPYEQIRVTPPSQPNKPILFETTDFVGLLMPVRLSGASNDFGFEVMTGDEIAIGFTPTVEFEKRIARKPKATAS